MTSKSAFFSANGLKPIVFLHAFPLSHLIWNQLKPIPGYQFLTPDFPGFGGTVLANAGFTLGQAARNLERQLSQQNIPKPFTLAGISMGGYWAFEYYRQFSNQVDQLILISTKSGADKPEGRQNRLKMAEKVEKEGVNYLPEAMIPGLLGKTTLADKPSVKQLVTDWINQTPPQAVASAQRAMADRRDQTSLLALIKAKTLILAGREDALIPFAESEAMSKLISSSRLQIIDKVGHLIPIEAPHEFQNSIEVFLKS
jgi:3-oxoadipate enol-lactonase